MKIGVLTSLFPSSVRPREGIFALRRWAGMRDRGHEIRIVQPTPRVPWPLGMIARRRFGDLGARPARETLDGLTIERPRYLHISGLGLSNAKRFAKAGVAAFTAIPDWRPEAVVCDYAWPACAAAEPLAAAGIGCVISGRGSDVLEVESLPDFKRALAESLVIAGAWCGVSNDLVTAMDRIAGQESGKLVANGVDGELFTVSHRLDQHGRDQLRRRLDWSLDESVVLVVGHLIQRKDPLLSLAAFVSCTHPKRRLVFVGVGPLEQEIRRAIGESKTDQTIELLGERDPQQLAQLYAAADVLLLTSSREGRPNVVLEALSSGLPVVATAAGGTAELLEPGPLAAIESRDPSRIAAALDQVLSAPPSPESLSESVTALSWEAGLETLEQLIRSSCP